MNTWGTGPFVVVTFAEGEVEEVVRFESELEARGFRDGYGVGAGHYGAGMATALIVSHGDDVRAFVDDVHDQKYVMALAAAMRSAGLKSPEGWPE